MRLTVPIIAYPFFSNLPEFLESLPPPFCRIILNPFLTAINAAKYINSSDVKLAPLGTRYFLYRLNRVIRVLQKDSNQFKARCSFWVNGFIWSTYCLRSQIFNKFIFLIRGGTTDKGTLLYLLDDPSSPPLYKKLPNGVFPHP